MFGDERRFLDTDLDKFLGVGQELGRIRVRTEVLYVRVSGSTGQESSLVAQEQELRASTPDGAEVLRVYKDRGSGLNENRPGLTKLLQDAKNKEFTVVRVTHADRLARFGSGWITQLLERDGVTVEVLHPKASSGMEELLEDFTSLIATFAGRMYGIRSKAAKARLLAAAAAQETGTLAPAQKSSDMTLPEAVPACPAPAGTNAGD